MSEFSLDEMFGVLRLGDLTPTQSAFAQGGGKALDLLVAEQDYAGALLVAIWAGLHQTLRGPRGADGVLRARGLVVVSAVVGLRAFLAQVWFPVFPATLTGSSFAKGERHAVHCLRFASADGGVHLDVEFIEASHRWDGLCEEMRVQEYSWAFIDHAEFVPDRVVRTALARVGRYPDMRTLPPSAQAAMASGHDPRPRRVWVVARQMPEANVWHGPDCTVFEEFSHV